MLHRRSIKHVTPQSKITLLSFHIHLDPSVFKRTQDPPNIGYLLLHRKVSTMSHRAHCHFGLYDAHVHAGESWIVPRAVWIGCGEDAREIKTRVTAALKAVDKAVSQRNAQSVEVRERTPSARRERSKECSERVEKEWRDVRILRVGAETAHSFGGVVQDCERAQVVARWKRGVRLFDVLAYRRRS